MGRKGIKYTKVFKNPQIFSFEEIHGLILRKQKAN